MFKRRQPQLSTTARTFYSIQICIFCSLKEEYICVEFDAIDTMRDIGLYRAVGSVIFLVIVVVVVVVGIVV